MAADSVEPGLTIAGTPSVVTPGSILDPMISLATSVHSSPGVYALLLGSGVSSAVGIPTGWQVVTNLVRKASAASAADDPTAADQAGEDPEGWWSRHGDGQPLGYSSLLKALAPTAAARQRLLAGYFEPTGDDRDEGRKVPGVAHSAIANLAARGAIRVILTTNFDRLIERALEDAGVPPQVLHRPEQFAGATPLAHARVTVIKLHGDYADLDQRNTIDELATYPAELTAFLRQVLDEYGLIISGWSGDWDVALVHALEETHARRYPLYWALRGAASESARRLIGQHGAVSLNRLTADELFTGILDRLEALDHLADPPVSLEIAKQRLKRNLATASRRIDLFDMIDMETTRLVEKISDEQRHPLGEIPLEDQRARYEEDTRTLATLLAIGVFHGETSQQELWLRALQRLLNARRRFSGQFNDATERMRHYPALLALWAMGVSAVSRGDLVFLGRLLTEPQWIQIFGTPEPCSPVRCLNPDAVVSAPVLTPNGQRWQFPASHYLRAVGRILVVDVEPDHDRYNDSCNRFEYLASLVALSDGGESGSRPWLGEFILTDTLSAMHREVAAGWSFLSIDAFAGDLDRARNAHQMLLNWLPR